MSSFVKKKDPCDNEENIRLTEVEFDTKNNTIF